MNDALTQANQNHKYPNELMIEDRIPVYYKHPKTMRKRKGIGVVFDTEIDNNSPHMTKITVEIVGVGGYFTTVTYPNDELITLIQKK